MILSFVFIPSIFNTLRSLSNRPRHWKGKNWVGFQTVMILNERFQMKTVRSYANAADIASYSQIFSKLSLCQGAILREWVFVKVYQIKKKFG